ncbi:MAG: EutP/PduV family microcompartment system protein [Anaerovoracaceae bacterium]
MRRKRVMVIGPSRCGKTSLVRRLDDDERPVRRTPDMIYGKHTIDCPGSYIENTDHYQHLIAASQDASHVLMLIDQSNPVHVYSPKFAKAFTKPVIGVVTKSDLNPENREDCLHQMNLAGVTGKIFEISVHENKGVDELKKYLFGSEDTK